MAESATASKPLLSAEFMRKLDRLDVLSRKMLQGKLHGERRSKRRGRSVEFADYRNYTPGDDPRFIDWNLYARLDRLFLRLFLAEEDLSVSLLIDATRSMDWPPSARLGDGGTGGAGGTGGGERPDTKLLYAKRLAAALGYIGLVNYNRVHAYAFRRSLDEAMINLRGRRPVSRLLSFLQGIEAEGRGDLSSALRRFALTQRAKGVVIVISDFLEKGELDEALRYLAHERYDVFAIHVLSPDELDPRKGRVVGDLRLRDIEDGDTAEVSITSGLLRRYESNLTDFCDTLRQSCLRRGAAYTRCSTDEPFDRLVLKHLAERGLVG